MTDIRPRRLDKVELLRVLEDMIAHIQVDDSFGGTLTYEATDRDSFDVYACYRIGNREGQGGTRVIEGVDPAEICETTNKKIFRTPEQADKRRKLIRRQFDDRQHVYRCDDCGFWHLGHHGRLDREITEQRAG